MSRRYGNSREDRSKSPRNVSNRYNDFTLELLESTFNYNDLSDERDERRSHSNSRSHRSHNSRERKSRSRERDGRKRRSTRSRSYERRHPNREEDAYKSKKVKSNKPSFLEEMTQQFPDIKNEMINHNIMTNMQALQEFGMPVQPQQQFMNPSMPFQPVGYNMIDPTFGMHMPMMSTLIEPVPPPSATLMPNLLEISAASDPMIVNESILHGLNPEPPPAPSPPRAPRVNEKPIDLMNATKKAFEDGNIELSDLLRQKVKLNKKKLEATSIQSKKRQVVDKCKRTLQLMSDISKDKIILPLLFKKTNKKISHLSESLTGEMLSPLVLSEHNLKFSWQQKTIEAHLSNPVKNISTELIPVCRNIPLNLYEVGERAKTRVKIERNKKANANQVKLEQIQQALIPVQRQISQKTSCSQTDPLICPDCHARAKTLITTRSIQVEEDLELRADPGMFKFQLSSLDLLDINHEQRMALSKFCRAFNIYTDKFVIRDPSPIERIPQFQRQLSPLMSRRNNISPNLQQRIGPIVNRSPPRIYNDDDQRMGSMVNRSPPRNYNNDDQRMNSMVNRSPPRNYNDDDDQIFDRYSNRLEPMDNYGNGQFIDFNNDDNYTRGSNSRSPARVRAVDRLGHKVPSESPVNSNRNSRIFDDSIDYDGRNMGNQRISPQFNRRSRSPYQGSRNLSPPRNSRYVSPPNSRHRNFDIPPREIYNDNYQGDMRERMRLNDFDEFNPRMRDDSPPRRDDVMPRRQPSPNNFENRFDDVRPNRSRSPPNWFKSSREGCRGSVRSRSRGRGRR